jgi:hypothetical protein
MGSNGPIVRWLKPPVVVLGDGLCLNQLEQLVVELAVQRAENLEDLRGKWESSRAR